MVERILLNLYLKDLVCPRGAVMKRVFLFLMVLMLPGVLWASSLSVVATIYPLTAMVKAVGGDRVEVATLVPPGASPHGFELRPSHMKAIQRASLLVKVGAHLDDWLDKALKGKGKRVFILSQGLDLEEGNPHVWLDPFMVEKRVPELVGLLSKLDPLGAGYYRERGRRFQLELERVTAKIRVLLASMPCRYYVAQHGAWYYFCQRFGLTSLGVVEEVPGREPGPRRFMYLLKMVKEYAPVLLFADRGENPRAMEVLARDSGGILVTLDPLGDPKDPEKRDLVSLFLYDARRIYHGCTRR